MRRKQSNNVLGSETKLVINFSEEEDGQMDHYTTPHFNKSRSTIAIRLLEEKNILRHSTDDDVVVSDLFLHFSSSLSAAMVSYPNENFVVLSMPVFALILGETLPDFVEEWHLHPPLVRD